MKKKKIIRLTENDIERLVKKILKEDEFGNFDWINQDTITDFPGKRPPIKRVVTDFEKFMNYCRGTRWSPCSRNGKIYFDMYQPFTIFISGDDKVKIACVDNNRGGTMCFDQNDNYVTPEEAADMLMVSSLDVIGENGIIEEGEGSIHTKKWDRCVEDVKAQGKSEESAYKICSSSIKDAGVKKSHQQKKGKQYVANRKKKDS